MAMGRLFLAWSFWSLGILWSGSPTSLGHGDMWFQETVLLLSGLLHHLCTGSDWDGHQGHFVTFLALETVAWEQRLFQTKVLLSPGKPGLCRVAVRGDRLFRS